MTLRKGICVWLAAILMLSELFVFSPKAGAAIANPQGFWKFDESSGLTASDSSGSNNSATMTNTSWVAGKVGNALSFNGTDASAVVPIAADPTSFTVSAWVKPTAIRAENIFVRSNGNPVGAFSHQLLINSSGKFEAYMYDGVSKSMPGTTIVQPDTWYFVALTATNGGQMKLYVNGQLEGTPTAIGTMWTGGDRYHFASNGGGHTYFKGLLDEVRLNYSELTAAEILSIYNSTANASNNSISISSPATVTENAVTLTGVGDRQSITGTILGEDRYIPSTWSSTEAGKSGSFALNAGSYTSTYTPSAIGAYTVTVTFKRQRWNGTAWSDIAGDTGTKTTSLTVKGLKSLTPSIGTLSPTFASTTTSYSIAVSNSTSSIMLTPEGSDATVTVTVNGVATASGSASAPINLPVGTTNIQVVATADGVSKTYNVAVTRDDYIVNYFGNGATSGTPPASVNYSDNDTVTVSDIGDLVKSGFVFSGWNTAADGSGTPYAVGETFPASTDLNLYAQWLNSGGYIVSYDSNGATSGVSPSAAVYAQNSRVTAQGPGSLTRTGYTFAGWNTAADGSGTSYAEASFFTMPTSNVTLYAKWTVSSYSVTLNTNGGTGTPTGGASYSYGDTVNAVRGTMARTGYNFAGWNTAADGTGTFYAATGFTMPAQNLTLYAQWTTSSYIVSYYGNGETGGSAPTALSYNYGATVTVPNAGSMVRTGYSFNGWNTMADGSGTALAANSTFSMPALNVTLYAQWTVNAYTLTLNANGGSGAPTGAAVYDYGAAVNAGAGTLSRSGYTFTGWNTASDGSGASYVTTGFTMPAQNLTLYAQWTANAQVVSYDANGATSGTAPAAATHSFNSTVTVAGAGTLSKTGSTFAGWNTLVNGSGTSYPASSTFTMPASNVTLYAQWTPVTYTVTLSSNGASGTGTGAGSYHYGDTVNAGAGGMNNPGFTFAGWNTAADGSGTTYTATGFTMPAQDLTLYARWTTNTYRVVYDNNLATSGTVPAMASYNFNATVTVPGAGTLARAGYTFTGWNTRADGSGIAYAANANFSMPSLDVVLYAQWSVNTYSVTVNSNGGSGSGTGAGSYLYGSTVNAEIGTMAKPGYTLAGWNTASNGTGVFYASTGFTMPDENLTLYAQWTTDSFIVSYYGNGAASGTVPTAASYSFNATVTVPDAGTLDKPGYNFASWNTLADGSGTSYATNDTFSMPSSNVTLYAQWAVGSNTITLNSNGGTGAPTGDGLYSTGATVTADVGTMTRTGYRFAGWNTVANGSGTHYPSTGFAMPAVSLILYAQWLPYSYIVSYYGNGATSGTVPTAVSYDYGTAVTISNVGTLIKTGYTFTEWNTAADGSGTAYGANDVNTMPAQHITLYAQWTVNAYTVTLSNNGGSGTSTVSGSTYNYDDTVNAAVGSMVNPGYTFAGWNTAADGSGAFYPATGFTMPAQNLTLYAQWTNASYMLGYYENRATGGAAPAAALYAFNDNVNLQGAGTLVKTGYTFAGWNTAADGSGTAYAASDAIPMPAENVTLYAQWSIDTHTVTLDPNGGIGAPDGAGPYNYGATVNAGAGAMTRIGYTLTGWNTAADGNGTFYPSTGFTMPATDLTLYARWTPNSYVLSYYNNGATSGDAPAATLQSYNADVPAQGAGALQKSGSVFAGWNIAADGTGTMYPTTGTFAMPANDLTLYAVWTDNAYTVTLSTNGGTGSSTGGGIYNGGATVTAGIGTMEYPGFMFAGWNTAQDGTGTAYAATGFTMPAENLTLYAQWTANAFIVSYYANGATSGDVPTAASYILGTNVTVSNVGTLTKSGYSFAGWNTLADGSGTAYAANARFSMPAANVTLYAQWTANIYTVTLFSNGATGTGTGAGSYDTDDNVVAGVGTMARSRYRFTSWNTAADGSGTYYSATGFTMPAQNLTLYAQWESTASGGGASGGGGGGGGGGSIPTTPPTTDPNPGTTDPDTTDDIFNSNVTSTSRVVDNIQALAAEANQSNEVIDMADVEGHWAEQLMRPLLKMHIFVGYPDGKYRPNGTITRAEFAMVIDRVFDVQANNSFVTNFKDTNQHWARKTIEKLASVGVITGYWDGSFQPDKTISREEMVIILSRVVDLNKLKLDPSKGNFNDLSSASKYAQNAIRIESQAGIVNGTEKGDFNPKGRATRAEAAIIIMNVLNLASGMKPILDSLK